MRCRLCHATGLDLVLDLGLQRPSGHFPSPGDPPRRPTPLQVHVCYQCGLAQLFHDIPPEQQFCGEYGYRSGLNEAMVEHLHLLATESLLLWNQGRRPQAILDIGCNDGTLLQQFPEVPVRIGIDPSPWLLECPDGITRWKGFFPEFAPTDRRFDLIFTVAMFYDLEEPLVAAQRIHQLLEPEGLWVCEVADWSTLVREHIWDGVCHEHLTYWTDGAMQQLAVAADLAIVSVQRNACNGGSVRYYLKHATRSHARALFQPAPTRIGYQMLQDGIKTLHGRLQDLLGRYARHGEVVHLYGASTKANVLLQACGIDARLAQAAAERSPTKVGRWTATGIPILDETTSRAVQPSAYLVGPWHFREAILRRERTYPHGGTRFIFPLPHLSSVSVESHQLSEVR